MINSRRGTAVAIAVVVALSALCGFAIAQSSPSSSTKKPAVGLSTKKINFGSVPAGTQSDPHTVMLTNKGSVDLAAPVVSVTGTGFMLGKNGCMNTIAPSGDCTVSVIFAPPTKGKFKHGLLKFTDGGAKSPQKVKLVGVGLAASQTPTPTATPTSTSSGTPSPTSTATATATASPTGTATPTHTVTGTATATGTASRTPTATATSTATTTPTATSTATPIPGANVVFVTSQTYDGSINGAMGLAGADSKCAALAAAAHLPVGNYKAWLSTSTVTAISRLGAARAFVRVDGAPIADKISDLIAGKILNPIDIDESGTDIRQAGNSDVWTGSTNTGTLGSLGACVDWTSTSNMDFGETGHFDGGPTQWSDISGGFSCNDAVQNHLYCFDTSHAETLSVTPVTGRVAFVSKGNFDPSTGIPTADALCQSEATSAGLPSPSTFLALLSTSTASAASRFNVAMGSAPFVRPDGIKIADAPKLAAGDALDSGIWQHADGTYFSGFDPSVWTGCAEPIASCVQTCSDWTMKSSMVTGVSGTATETEPLWWDSFENLPCTSSKPVYCLEQ